ncbi:MAG: helical backbone metal receptor [Desulfurococcales archaeon]|nr:helical backbone metal receptor [Desulfurococcales archaeon]
MDRALAVASAALIIALIGFGAIYAGITSLKTQLEEANNRIANLQNEVKALKEASSGYASTTQLEDVRSALQEISGDIKSIQSKIEKAATQGDVQEIALQVASLQERLAALEKLASEELKGQIEELTTRLDELQAEVQELSARIKFPVVVTDATGEQVFIASEPERIVSLAPAVTETLYFIGALDKLVGVDEYSNYPPVVAEMVENGTIKTIGGFWNPSIEEILSLEPDLVIGVDAPPHKQVKEVLRDYGIPVIILPQNSIDDVKRSIIITGMATGNMEQAIDVLGKLSRTLAQVKTMADSIDGKVKVALIVWVNPIFVAGNDTFQNDIIEFAGGINAFANLTGWPVVSAEDLLAAKPDVIILSRINVTDFLNILVGQLGDSALEIPAVANKRIYTITGDYADMLSRPSPRIAQIIPLIQYILYPHLYGSTPGDIPQTISPETMPETPQPQA